MNWQVIHNIQKIIAYSPLAASNGDLISSILRITVLSGLGVAGVLAVLLWKKNMTARVTYLRIIIQLISFAAFFYLFTFNFAFLYLMIAIFAVTLFIGRFYCSWLCPFGFVMDLEVMVRKALKIRYRILPDKLNKALHQSRYIILLSFFLLPIPLWLINPPPGPKFAELMAQLLAGPFLPYGILIAPMMPFIVPWTSGTVSLFTINWTFPYVSEFLVFIGENSYQVFAIVFVGLTLVGSFFIRRVWCRFCPTGASLAVVNRFNGLKWTPLLHIEKDEKKCTKCGVCKRVCPVQVTEVYDQNGGKIKTSQCMVCTRCVEMCPYEDTLKVKLGSKTVFKSRNWLEPAKSE